MFEIDRVGVVDIVVVVVAVVAVVVVPDFRRLAGPLGVGLGQP